MQEIPIIDIQIRNIRESLATAFMVHSRDLENMTIQALNAVVTPEILEARIRVQADEFINVVIKRIFENYELQQQIAKEVLKGILK